MQNSLDNSRSWRILRTGRSGERQIEMAVLAAIIRKRRQDPRATFKDALTEVDVSKSKYLIFKSGAKRRIRQIFPLEPVE